MSLRLSNLQNINSPVKPLQQNNGQLCGIVSTPTLILKDVKVTARADSTGLENNQSFIIKHHHSVKKMQTPSVARRNARERNRVKVVNSGFDVLKTHVPHLKNKVSKVETLRAAVEYIKALKELLGQEDDCSHTGPILIDDDDSNFSDLNDSTFSAESALSHATDLQDVALHPMVYQLPPASAIPLYHSPPAQSTTSPLFHSPPSVEASPISLSPPITIKLEPAVSSTAAAYLPSLSPPSRNSGNGEGGLALPTTTLPSLSVAARAWWPEPPTTTSS